MVYESFALFSFSILILSIVYAYMGKRTFIFQYRNNIKDFFWHIPIACSCYENNHFHTTLFK